MRTNNMPAGLRGRAIKENVDMDELISKRAVIEAIEKARANVGHNLERSIGKSIIEILDEVGKDVGMLPSAESESFEWCTDCKEYDQEAHCCHRWSKMIRKTIEEMKLVHCIDCQHSEYDSVYGERWCHYNGKAEIVDDYHYCRDGERRDDG